MSEQAIVVMPKGKKKQQKQKQPKVIEVFEGPATEKVANNRIKRKLKKLQLKEQAFGTTSMGPITEVANLRNQLKQLKQNQQLLAEKQRTIEKMKTWTKQMPNIANAADFVLPHSKVDRADLSDSPMVSGLGGDSVVPNMLKAEPLSPAQEMIYRGSFQKTRFSKYLRSMLLPATGPASIPDNITRLHSTHSETVTSNIQSPTSKNGLFLIYPNHPGKLIGYHYFDNGGGQYEYERTITTAQDLELAYDYGRKVSQIIKIFSSTVPGGSFNVNGTINAVRVDGTVTEIENIASPATLYGTMLASTSSSSDKIGDVSVVSGVGVLSIPTAFNNPYRRFQDATPATLALGSLDYAYVDDGTSDLVYKTQVSRTPIATTGTLVTLLDHQFNVDSTGGIDVGIELLLTGTFAGATTVVHQTIVEFIDPFGTVLVQNVYGESWDMNVLAVNYSDFILATLPEDYSTGPLGSVRIQVQLVDNGLHVTAGTIIATITARVPTGAMIGVNNPVVLCAYQNVQSGSTITVSGVSNFELIPNPELRKNLTLTYPQYDPDEMDYVERIVGNRELINLRSVYDYRKYTEDQPLYEELCSVGSHSYAKAFGWGDILGSIKDKFLPAVWGGVKDTAGDVLKKAVGNAASGKVLIRAADRWLPPAEGRLPVLTRKMFLPHIKRKEVANLTGCAFPCVISNDKGENIGCTLYAAVPGDQTRYLTNPNCPVAVTKTGIKIYNYGEQSPINLPITRSLTLLPIRSMEFSKNRHFSPIPGEEVTGHSCDAAMIVASRYPDIVFPYPITGEVKMVRDVPVLETNPMYEEKAYYCGEFGMPLLGNYPPLCKLKLVDDIVPTITPPHFDHRANTKVKACEGRLAEANLICDGITNLQTVHAADKKYYMKVVEVNKKLDDISEQAVRTEDLKGLVAEWCAMNEGIEDPEFHRLLLQQIYSLVADHKAHLLKDTGYRVSEQMLLWNCDQLKFYIERVRQLNAQYHLDYKL